jgi:xanthine/CO dehydrogenase XdhC/CoxF family maturation factor
MKNSFDEKILEEANDWVNANQKVVLATVIQTWGSSPRQVGSRMIVNEKGDFSGSVSGGCVESAVVRECIGLIKDNKPCKKLEFKVSNESAWEVGLACGGEIKKCRFIQIKLTNFSN